MDFEKNNIKNLKNFKPLTHYNDMLIVSDGNLIYKYDIATRYKEFVVSIPVKKKLQWLRYSTITKRLLRLDIPIGQYIDRYNLLFVSTNGMIYEIDIEQNKITSSYPLPNGSRVLNFTFIEGLKGFNDGLYFGEYFNNSEFGPVSVYRRCGAGKWEKTFTFPSNSIYHIHNIVPDYYRNCAYIFSGDLDEHSAIWKCTDGFDKVNALLKGSQLYRACVGMVLPDRLVYGTDSQLSVNYLCEIVFEDGDKFRFDKISEIEGSVIYGGKYNNGFLFSTSVEPGIFSTSMSLGKIFTNRIGTGNKSRNATVIIYNPETRELKEIDKNKKDKLPFLLFQFGSIMFPTNMESSPHLVYYNIGLQREDCSMIIKKMI